MLTRQYWRGFVVGALAVGCSPSVEEKDEFAAPGVAGGGAVEDPSDPNGLGNPNPQGNPSNPQDPGLGSGLGKTADRGGVSADDACNSQPVEPKVITVEVPITTTEEIVTQKPTALFLMLDRSASMIEPGLNKWGIAQTALTGFINDPASAGLQVALQYFPLDAMNYGGIALIPGLPPPPGPGCQDVAGHGAAVPMSLLPEKATDLTGSLGSTGIQDLFVAPPEAVGTPIEPALAGPIAACVQFQTENPDWQCINVLITDGVPTSCSADGNALAQIAGNAWTAHQIRTFTVGMQGADFNLLDRIAAAGQGDCHPPTMGTFESCDVTSGPQAFNDALKVIRESISTVTHTTTTTELVTQPLECEFGLPDAPTGQTLDPTLVNVQLTDSAATQTTIKQVQSLDDCFNHGGAGWYYDNPAAPTKILTCEQTCQALKALEGAKVDVLLGCKTEPA